MNITEYVTGLQHIGIPTAKLEGMETYLCGLGFVVIQKEVQPDGRPVAFLQLQNLVLEVYETENPAAVFGKIDHLALDVRGIDMLYETMKKEGYEAAEGCVGRLPFWENGISYFTLKGPEGLKIEFCQKDESRKK